jgi:hypothetical protein
MTEENKNQTMLSVKEFKMWLQGVEEMQSEDWVPDARQWQRIRSKIDMINDAQPSPSVTNTTSENNSLPAGSNLVFRQYDGSPPGGVSGNGVPVPTPSSLNVPPTSQPVRRIANTASGMPVSLATGDATVANPVKTPNLDRGNYNPKDSQFV